MKTASCINFTKQFVSTGVSLGEMLPLCVYSLTESDFDLQILLCLMLDYSSKGDPLGLKGLNYIID